MKIYILLLLGVFPYLLSAQDSNPYNNIIPPNPDAASLVKYVDFPVDLSRGVPQINIPLWSIQCGDINVPISLSYHASGIPVAETPSYVGLGWTLNAGGAIARTIRGVADDGMYKWESSETHGEWPGILLNYPQYAIKENCSADEHNPNKYGQAAIGKVDLEPDMFYYNFGNYSGKFVFDFEGNAHLIPRKNFIIEKVHNQPLGNRRIIKWTITTDDGLKYHFDEVEETRQDLITDIDYSLGPVTPIDYHQITTNEYYSAWYLTKIEMPDSTKYVEFKYDPIVLEYTFPVSERERDVIFYSASHSPWGGSGNEDNRQITEELSQTKKMFGSDTNEETQSTSTITGRRLRKIIAPDQTVEFIPGNYRHDLKGDRVLDKVVVKNKAGEILKQFKLSYNYFSSNSMVTKGTANADTEADTKLRLSLKSIREYDKNGNGLPPYTFEYESSVWLPDRVTSKAHDHWGYYNGEDENVSLIPYKDTSGEYLNLNIRNASADHIKAGSLVKISYPTGGYTEFDLEANTFGSTSTRLNRISAYAEFGGCVYDKSKGTFKIDDDSKSVKVKIRISGNYSGSHDYCGSECDTEAIDPDDPLTHVHLAIVGPNEIIMLAEETAINGTMGPIDIEEDRILYNGTYEIKAVKKTTGGSFVEIDGCNASPYNKIRYSVEGIQLKSYDVPMTVGGLRIKEKRDFDPVSNQSLIKQYDYNISENLSSGYIGYVPIYNYRTDASGWAMGNHVIYQVAYNYYTSSSNSALYNGGENVISYEKVTVTERNDDIGINGKTENYYSLIKSFTTEPFRNSLDGTVCFNIVPEYSSPKFPFAPAVSGAWGTGLLKLQRIYKFQDNTYIKIKEIENNYEYEHWDYPYYDLNTDVLAAKVGTTATSSTKPDGIGTIAIQFYFIPSRINNLIKTIETDYDDNENPIFSKVTEIEYDDFSPHIYPVKTTTILSDGKELIKKSKYPKDFDYDGVYGDAAEAIKEMNARNIISKPIEIVNYKNNNAVGGTVYEYRNNDNDIPMLSHIYSLETDVPLGASDFTSCTYQLKPNTASTMVFVKDDHYKLATTIDFYEDGNPTQITTKDGVTVSYLWGYDNTYPVAKIENATYAEVEDALSDCRIGMVQEPCIYALKRGEYLIGYDSNKNGRYVTLDGDDVRMMLETLQVNLPDAFMTTYTYEPLVGMVSETAPDGTTIYYEYDDFGRLKGIKDNEGNIVKSYKYNYVD